MTVFFPICLKFRCNNRRADTDGEIDFYQQVFYDNLDRLVQNDQYDTSLSGNLVARSVTNYDDLSRTYQSLNDAVDPTTGAVGNVLTDNTWFDPAGNRMKWQSGATHFSLADDWPDFTARFLKQDCARWPWSRCP